MQGSLKLKLLTSLGVALTALTCSGFAQEEPFTAGTWTRITNTPPFNASEPLLLTDGTVIVQEYGTSNWYKLTPDINGIYLNGTWSPIAPFPSNYGPLYYGTAVLADGRAIAEGGEYNFLQSSFTNLGAIYDPKANTWTAITPPPNGSGAGDVSSVVFPWGNWMVADVFNGASAITNPSTCPPCTWTSIAGNGKADRNDEEGWNLLPDGSILTTDAIDAPNSERYIATMQKWVSAGSTIVRLEDPNSQEIGPATLRPNGTVFATGACVESNSTCTEPGHTSVYTISSGSWTPGPDFPNGLDIADGPASILPDGNVLVCTSPGLFVNGIQMFEYDGSSLHPTGNIANAASEPSYVVRFLALPSGGILETDGSTVVEIYKPSGTYNSAWQPKITSFPQSVTRGQTYKISGTQFNGVSEGATYGDDAQMRTNYPLVRVTNNSTHHVKYWKTHNHSTMGVQTGAAIVSTNFDVPSGAETGASQLVVVANGIPSNPVAITVQ